MKEKVIRPDRQRRWTLFLLFWVCIFLAAAAGGWCLLFGYNQFYLELELHGEKLISVEYGEPVIDPGCRVLLKGTAFLRDGMELEIPVEVTGSICEEKLGKNALEYHAEYCGMQASALRVVRIVDTQCPVIELVPDPVDRKPTAVYQEAGFRAYDNFDGDLTGRVIRTEESGKIIYAVLDSSGNPMYVERIIPDVAPPEIRLIGGDIVTIPMGTVYREPGFTAYDQKDGAVTDRVVARLEQEKMDRYRPGSYTIRYSVTDSDGNEASAIRTVLVEPCKRPDIIYPKGKTIYLTFDDGPCPDTVRLLDLLKRYNVHATFFVVDNGYPEILRRMVEEGHSIGVHTSSHNYQKIYSGVDDYFEDAMQMQDVIRQATGVETWLLRFPGGSSNTISRFNKGIMTTLTKAVEDMGFSYFDWNVDSDDAGKARKSEDVIANVQKGVQSNRISVVLMHDIHSYSVDAVEQIVLWGLDNGYTFLPLQTDSPTAHHGVNN